MASTVVLDIAVRDERFEFGLDCVLDGIAMQVQRMQGRKPD